MSRASRLKGSLRVAIASSAMLATSATTLAAQSADQQSPPRPKLVTPATESQPTDPAPKDVSLFTIPPSDKSKLESWLSGADVKCIGCRLFDPNATRPESTNPNAPFAFQAKWHAQTALGRISAGVLGVRNYAFSPSVGTPIGGDFNPGPLGSSSTAFLGPTSQWSLSAAYEKTLRTFRNGATISVVGDVMIPVSTTSTAPRDPRIGAMSSRTIRGGIVIRW